MSEQAVQKVFFVALCVLLAVAFTGIGVCIFANGPTGTYHVDASWTDGAMVSRVMQDRKFWIDTTMFRGPPTEAWELYWRLTEAAND